jgi:asparagine synthase (glutamine-hydrolysing)
MCGIFCLFLNRPLSAQDIAIGRNGVRALDHRGPDSWGEWTDAERGVYIGHCRLSIVDLTEASDQPMVRNGQVIAFNGEIYNHASLRDRLQGLGVRFQSKGDTEVLLQALQMLGAEALDAIDGMFAYAHWDGSVGTLATDSFGEKQLYYAETPEGIYVSSELPPLRDAVGAKPHLSPESLVALMSLDYIPAPATGYLEIKRLGPASILKIRNGTAQALSQYWKPEMPRAGNGTVLELSERQLDKIHEALCASTETRIQADAPMCAFLSGGVDSNLVVAIAAREFGASLDCITVNFPPGYGPAEGEVAAQSAALLGVRHINISSRSDPRHAGVDHFLDLFGQPNGNLTISSINQVAQHGVSNGFRVGLTGMGGDEVFSGYQKHSYFYKNRRYYRLPEAMRLFLGGMSRAIPITSGKLSAFQNLISVREYERYLAKKNQPTISTLRRIPNFPRWASEAFVPTQDPIEISVPYYELTEVMPNSQLPALDLGSMRASLELRTPFLSRRLHECVSEFDPRALLAFGQKSVLRRLLARYLPKLIVENPKLGFVFPQKQFLEQRGNAQPKLNGIPQALMQRIWERRFETGFQRLAVRAVLAERFLDRQY